ncbi:MAG: CARDB domain-containing protein [Chloroflexota bacterium]
MQLRMIFTLCITLLLVSACNLGGSPEPDLPLDDGDSQSAGQPSVSILSPSTGDTFTVNEQILVSVSANDEIGVTRVQLFANGSLVKTVSSDLSNGEVSFEGVLDFTPRSDGDFTLRVIAFREAISSPPEEIEVTVGQPQVIVTERSDNTSGSPGSGSGVQVPIIPNDGVCRVLTLVGLNMRTQPTTTRNNVITTFQANTLLNVVARLGDNSWWKVSSGNTVGWVSGNPQFVSLSGNCTSIPIETVVLNTPTPSPTPIPTNPPAPSNTPVPTATPLPDLTVPSIDVDDPVTIPQSETEVTTEVTIVIRNNGNGRSGQFDVSLRVERNGFEDVVYDVATVGALDPLTNVTLTQDITFDAADEYDIRVDVDPDNDVEETGEFNNRADTTIEVVQAP